MASTLDDVLITGELSRRPRAPDYELEARVLGALAEHLARDPASLPQAVVDLSAAACRGDSAGVSILEPDAQHEQFRWHALSGPFAENVNGVMPRDASPGGDVLRRNKVLLFDRPERFFPVLRGVTPAIHEALVAPWHLEGQAVATLWVFAHNPGRHFDAEDARLLQSLARMAAGACQLKLTHRSETHEAAAALRGSDERLRLIVESVRDYAIISMNANGEITSWNDGATRVFGYSAREAIGQSAAIIFTPEDRAACAPEAEMRKAAEHGRADDERWHLHKSGRRLYVSGVITPLRVDGKIQGFVKVARDVTDHRLREHSLQQSRDELEQRVQQRTRELSDAAHALEAELRDREAAENRIRNLFTRLVRAQEDERRRISREIHDQIGQQITALRMNLERMRQHCQTDPDAVEQIERTARLAQALDDDIDFLARDLRPMALDLGLRAALEALVRGWSEHFRIPADYHEVGVESVRLPEHAETHMYRIAQEALHNVARHADASTVAVVLECRGDEVSLMIEDDGCGFDPEGSASARAGMGMLGIRERASLIGGKVEIESSPGNGATVYVRVPVSRDR